MNPIPVNEPLLDDNEKKYRNIPRGLALTDKQVEQVAQVVMEILK